MAEIPPTWEIVGQVGRELLRFGIQEYMRYPSRPKAPVPPLYYPTPGVSATPTIRYQPATGCPWCAVVRFVAPALVYVQWAMEQEDQPGLRAAYRKMAADSLDECLAMLAATGGPVYRLDPAVRDLQGRLRAPDADGRMAELVGPFWALIKQSLTRAQTPERPIDTLVPAPHRVNAVSGNASTAREGGIDGNGPA